jgi:hypothetical protein
MTYGLVFCGNSYHRNTVFKLQKRIIRIMVGIRDREYFRKLKILPLQSQYIFLTITLILFKGETLGVLELSVTNEDESILTY